MRYIGETKEHQRWKKEKKKEHQRWTENLENDQREKKNQVATQSVTQKKE